MSNLELLQPETIVKLDLACGQTPKEGFEGVDISAPEAKWKINLLTFPWPWEDCSVSEIFCSHFIEHIPMAYVDDNNQYSSVNSQTNKDLLCAFFDECYRILKPGCDMLTICPIARSNRAFQDPTHRRFIVHETFLYLNADWRKLNKLDHYNINCNFGININHTMPNEEGLRHPDAQSYRFNHLWNTAYDLYATLRKL